MTENIQLSLKQDNKLSPYDALPVGVFLTDVHGNFTYVNPTCQSMVTTPSEKILGHHWMRSVHAEDRLLLQEKWREFVKGHAPFRAECRFFSPSKPAIWTLAEVRENRNQSGEFVGYIGTLTNITREKEQDLLLQESNELLERIFANPHASVAYLDTDFNFIRVNQTYAQADSKDVNFFTGKNHFDLYPNAENEQIFRRVVANQEPYFAYAKAFEYAFSPERGVTHWDWSLWPIKESAGNVVGVLLVLVDVSQRVNVESQLRCEKSYVDAILQTANALIVVLDNKGNIERFNMACEKVTGYSAGEVVGRPIWDILLPPDQMLEVRQVFDNLKNDALNNEFTNEWLCKDGSRRLLHWNNSVLANEQGVVEHIIAVGVDITAQESMTQRLRITQAAMDISLDAVSYSDLSGNLTYVNQAFLDIWGYQSVDQVLGRSAVEFWQSPQQAQRVVEELMRHGKWLGELTGKHSDGSSFPVRLAASMVTDTLERPLCLMATFVDLTQQKKVERHLSELIEFNRTIVDKSPVGIGIYNQAGQCVAANEALARTVKATKAQVEAQNFHDIPSWRECGLYDLALKTMREQRTQHGEFHVVTSFGKEMYVEVFMAVFRRAGEQHLLLMVSDISARRESLREMELNQHMLEQRVSERTRELEEALAQLEADNLQRREAEQVMWQLKNEAEHANRMKSEFLSRMSHELRTPMNAILGFSQLLSFENLTSQQKDFNSEVLSAGDHLLQLINEVLDLSRVESGAIQYNLDWYDVNELVQNAVAMIMPMAQDSGISVCCHLDAGAGIRIHVDDGRFKEVVLNLLTNAIKYNSPSGRVDVGVKYEDETVRIDIHDTGIGLDTDEIKMAFEPFNRLGAQYSSIEGTGIGLTISKRIIEDLGGRIDVKSTKGVGSNFGVEFPAQLYN